MPLPRSLIQMVTMGALVAAFALALAMNLRLRVRPSAFLLLLGLLLVPSLISSVDLSAGFGALFRCGRFAVFVATLWLVSRWWDGSTTFVRYHIRWYFLVLCSVAAGLVLSPGAALPDLYGGRLVGALWPLTPPQIGQYAAVVVGLAVLLVLGRLHRPAERRAGDRAVAGAARPHAHPDGDDRAARGSGGGDRLHGADQRRRPPLVRLGAGVRGGRRGRVRVAAPGVVPARADRGELLHPHRPRQGVGGAAGRAAHRRGAAVRGGARRQVVRRPAHRQQLARRLPRTGPPGRGVGRRVRAGRRPRSRCCGRRRWRGPAPCS